MQWKPQRAASSPTSPRCRLHGKKLCRPANWQKTTMMMRMTMWQLKLQAAPRHVHHQQQRQQAAATAASPAMCCRVASAQILNFWISYWNFASFLCVCLGVFWVSLGQMRHQLQYLYSIRQGSKCVSFSLCVSCVCNGCLVSWAESERQQNL